MLEQRPTAIDQEWALDISFGEPYSFVPYDKKKDVLLYGLSVVSNKCPGKLVGICSLRGNEHVEKWIKENPYWKERFTNEHSRQNNK